MINILFYFSLQGKCDGTNRLEKDDLNIPGIYILIHLIDFQRILDCADPLFILELVMGSSDSLTCLPEGVLDVISQLQNVLKNIEP